MCLSPRLSNHHFCSRVIAITMAILTVAAIALSLRLALCASVVYVVCWIVYTRCFHPLARVPGPWLASVTRAVSSVSTGSGVLKIKRACD